MNRSLQLAVLAAVLISRCSSCSAQTCQSYKFPDSRTYAKCIDLPVLNSFLHWNYTESSPQLDVAFRHVGATFSKWIAWAINPTALQMVGSQALVAYERADGLFSARTSSVDSYDTQLPAGNFSFGYSRLSGLVWDDQMMVFASLQLASGMVTINQVWQNDPLNGDTLAAHATSPDNLKSLGKLNLLTGATS